MVFLFMFSWNFCLWKEAKDDPQYVLSLWTFNYHFIKDNKLVEMTILLLETHSCFWINYSDTLVNITRFSRNDTMSQMIKKKLTICPKNDQINWHPGWLRLQNNSKKGDGILIILIIWKQGVILKIRGCPNRLNPLIFSE